MNQPGTAPSTARDTRLLVLTLFLSVAVLLLLARFRFPDRPRPTGVTAATALEEIATRGAFEDEGRAMRDLAQRLGPSIVRLRHGGGSSEGPRELAGLRIRDDLALVALATDARAPQIDAVHDGQWVTAAMVGRDYPRYVGVVRVPPQAAPVVTLSAAPMPVPGFVAAVGGDGAGTDIRPVWVGHLPVLPFSAWSGPVFAVPPSVAGLPRGSLLFTVGGTFLGLVSAGPGSPALIPARSVLDRADLLARGRQFEGGDAGILVQDVDTAPLRAAVGGHDGALVTSVAATGTGPAPGVGPGDLITHVDGELITGRAAFLHALARREAHSTVTLTVMRAGQTRRVPVLLRSPLAAAAGPDTAPAAAAQAPGKGLRDLGVAVRQRGAELEIVGVDAAGSGHEAGLRTGDRITWIDGVDAPSSAGLDDAFRRLDSKGTLLLRIRPAGADGQRRDERVVALTRS